MRDVPMAVESAGATDRPADQTEPLKAVAANLRSLRQAAGFTVREAAARAGVSHGLLSQVETGRTTPSLTTLSQLARVYQVGLVDVFGRLDGAANHLVRRHDRVALACTSPNTRDWLLAPAGPNGFTVLLSVVDPRSDSGELASHAGSTEFLHVLRGVLEIVVSEQAVALYPGDSITIDPERLHQWRNPSAEPAEVLCVVQAPPVSDVR